MIKLGDLIKKETVREVLESDFVERVRDIQSGKVIKAQYAKATKIKRRKAGLQVDHVDLTGNKKYSKKIWRFVGDWRIKMIDQYTAEVTWTHKLSKILLAVHTRRYGKIFSDKISLGR